MYWQLKLNWIITWYSMKHTHKKVISLHFLNDLKLWKTYAKTLFAVCNSAFKVWSLHFRALYCSCNPTILGLNLPHTGSLRLMLAMFWHVMALIQDLYSLKWCSFIGIGISIINLTQSSDHLRLMMGIPIPKDREIKFKKFCKLQVAELTMLVLYHSHVTDIFGIISVSYLQLLSNCYSFILKKNKTGRSVTGTIFMLISLHCSLPLVAPIDLLFPTNCRRCGRSLLRQIPDNRCHTCLPPFRATVNGEYVSSVTMDRHAITTVTLLGIILGMGSANEKQRHNVMSSFIGRTHTQNDPWFWHSCMNRRTVRIC